MSNITAPQKIEFIIIMTSILVLLMLPNTSPKVLELFDYSFINFISILIIAYAIKTNTRYGIMFTILYAFCLFQRRKNIAKELIEKQISEINITSYAKISSVLTILNDTSIAVEEREKLAIKSFVSDIPNIKKLNIIMLYLDNSDKKSTILDNLYKSNNKNIISMTKYIVKNPENISAVLKASNNHPYLLPINLQLLNMYQINH